MSVSDGAQPPAEGRRAEPWDAVLAKVLDAQLGAVAAALSSPQLPTGSIGILPAVYFPRLRMGSVVYTRWGHDTRDVDRAFPWNPGYIPPPFTCFVPPVAREDRVYLITDVARVIDEIGTGNDPEKNLRDLSVRPEEPRQIAYSEGLKAWIGTSSWTMRDGVASIIDAHLLAAADVNATTCIHVIPSLTEVPGYVPLLYVQSNDAYDHAALEREILRALTTSEPWSLPVHDAMRAIISAARLCATRWINPKSGLLNRTGFDALKDDLTRRVATGESYAECFFDIDGFKRMNDQLGYDDADLVAATVADRVLFFVQTDAAAEYARYRKQREGTPPNGFRALLAHVSGDEYKLFVQTDAVRKTIRPHPATLTRDSSDLQTLTRFAARIVNAAGTGENATGERNGWQERHAASFDRTRFGPRVPPANASVSIGIALLDPLEQDLPPFSGENYPHDDAALSSYRDGLNDLDSLVERAISGAKRRKENPIMFSDELLFEGGAIVEELKAGGVLISLGAADGVRVETEFDVFASNKPEHPGDSRAAVARISVVEVRERDADAEIVSSHSETTLAGCRIAVRSGAALPAHPRTSRVPGEIPHGQRRNN